MSRRPEPEYDKVVKALEVWRRHRRNGTMPSRKTVGIIVNAAYAWVKIMRERMQ